MPYKYLIFLHLFTVLPAFLFGAFLLSSTKGTKLHKAFGKLYAILISVTVLTTLTMPAEVGPRFFGHFGYTHLLSFYALYALVAALFAVYRGDIEKHRKNMIGLYIGGILVAGAFAFMPGRVIHNFIFS